MLNTGLSGKTVIVTGGASHIGRAITLAFASEGCNVVIADIDEVQAHKTVEQAKTLGGKAIFVKTDVTDYTNVQDMVSQAINRFKRVDILVNNVGGGRTIEGLYKKAVDNIVHDVNLNLLSTIYCTKAVVQHMVAQKEGRIINMSSVAGRDGWGPGLQIYAACKGGIISFTRNMAWELGRYNINVNAICPGMIPPARAEDTGAASVWVTKEHKAAFTEDLNEEYKKRIPLNRLGAAEDVADTVIFLASNQAGYITGQTLNVDGGESMH